MLIEKRLRIALLIVCALGLLGALPVVAALTAPRDAVAAEAEFAALAAQQVATLASDTHPDPGAWYRSSRVSFSWSSSDATVAGYSFLLDDRSDSTPDEVSEGLLTGRTYEGVADGSSYFHIRAVDASGAWGPTSHLRVNVDSSPPQLPLVTSATHGAQAVWKADRSPSFAWSAGDSVSGVTGYSFAIDQRPDTAPVAASLGAVTSASFPGLVDGAWYFHVRAVDAAGNWGPTQHHLVRVDVTPPGLPTVTSATHTSPGTPYALNDPSFTWSAIDVASGIGGCSYLFDRRPATQPDDVSEGRTTSRSYRDVATGTWYFHVRAVDQAGTWGPTAHFRIDVASVTEITPDGGGATGTTTSGTGGYDPAAATTTPSMPAADPDYSLLSRFPGAVFPVTGRYWYADWWHAPRSGGRLHEGCDIFAAYGTPLVAVQDGVISNVSTEGIGGNNLRLSNDQGDYFYYAHLSQFAPATIVGARVEAGQTIGYVGTTGDAQGTDPHLHFEIHPLGGPAVDPYDYLEAWRGAGSDLGGVTTIPGTTSSGGFDPSLAPAAESGDVATDAALVAALDRVAAGLASIDENLVDAGGGAGDGEVGPAEAVFTLLSGLGVIAFRRRKLAATRI